MTEGEGRIALLVEYDYSQLLDYRHLPRSGFPTQSREGALGEASRIVVDYPLGRKESGQDEDTRSWQEIYRLTADFGVIISHFEGAQESLWRYSSTEDWLAFEFRFAGAFVRRDAELAQPPEPQGPVCIVSFKPAGVPVERLLPAAEPYEAVSFVIRRGAVQTLLGLDPGLLGPRFKALMDATTPCNEVISLTRTPAIMDAVLGVKNCRLEEIARVVFFKGRFMELIGLIGSALEDSSPTPSAPKKLAPRDLRALRRARALLARDLSRRVTLSVLSAYCGLNRNKLSQGFRTLYGQTVHEYTHELRMVRAFELIHASALSVMEIALAVGYDSPSSLSKAFRERFGVTPTELRLREEGELDA